MKTFECSGFTFEPLKEADFPLLLIWLKAPHMRGKWNEVQSLSDVDAQFRGKIDSATQSAFIVYSGGEPFAYVQNYRATSAGPGWWPGESELTVGIDQFIGDPRYIGKGIGTKMVQAFSDWLLSLPNINKVITDPAPNNEPAIRCYRKAGFREVGLVDTPDGRELLMEKRAG